MPGFRHEALFYAGDDGFLAGTLPFLRDAVEAGENSLVAVSQPRARALQAELGDAAQAIHFVDMAQLGRNPARIIPAWHDFVNEHGDGGQPIRGIGEPIWPGRTEEELVECHQHESLLNLAFANRDSFWLVCPYDTEGLDPEVIEAAHHTHPLVSEKGNSRASAEYVAPGSGKGPFDEYLSPPVHPLDELPFSESGLRDVRRFAEQRARNAGLGVMRTADFVLAVGELATNSVVHGGGRGTVRAWTDDDSLVCEVHDGGQFERLLLGRDPLPPQGGTGRGLWLANHLCDLVQMRSSAEGSVVRVYMRLRD